MSYFMYKVILLMMMSPALVSCLPRSLLLSSSFSSHNLARNQEMEQLLYVFGAHCKYTMDGKRLCAISATTFDALKCTEWMLNRRMFALFYVAHC